MLGLFALTRTIRVSFRKNRLANQVPARLHVVGVALIVAALFPYISATDDVLRINHFSAQQDHQHPAKKHANGDLMRLYETMDTPVLSTVVVLAFSLFFVFLVMMPVSALIDRTEQFESGRSPPLLPA